MITSPKRFLHSKDAQYQAKVRRHFAIASWAFSNRKDDPNLRKIMTLLLENGYDIEDYSGIIPALARHKSEITSLRKLYDNAGFYTQDEIYESLEERGAF